MPTLTVTKTYLNGNTLSEGDLDGIKNSLETFFNVTKVANDNIQAGGVNLANLASLSVDENKLTTSVAGNGLAGGGGTALSVNVDGVTLQITSDTLSIKNGGVGSTQIVASGVGTTQIADGAVTTAKLSALNSVVSTGNSGTFSTTSTSFVAVTNLTVNITTTGNPVFIGLKGDGINTSFIGINPNSAGSAAEMDIQILNNSSSTPISTYNLVSQTSSSVTLQMATSAISTIDFPPAGSINYIVQVKVTNASFTGFLQQAKLVAYEIR